MAKVSKKLTPRQARFVEEYLVDLNATQAAIRAGYRASTAEQQGYQLLHKTSVQIAIQKRQSARSQRTQIDQDYVLRRLAEIDAMDVLDILNDDMSVKPVAAWPKIWRQFISGFDVAEMFEGAGDERALVGVMKKIRWPDKLKNLELLGKHISIGAFRDRVEVDAGDNLVAAILAARKRSGNAD